jgi:hypothetical protein
MLKATKIILLAGVIALLPACSSPFSVKETSLSSSIRNPVKQIQFVFFDREIASASYAYVYTTGKGQQPISRLEPGIARFASDAFFPYGVTIQEFEVVTGKDDASVARVIQTKSNKELPTLIIQPVAFSNVTSQGGRTGTVTMSAQLVEAKTNLIVWQAKILSSTDSFQPAVHGPMLMEAIAKQMRMEGLI